MPRVHIPEGQADPVEYGFGLGGSLAQAAFDYLHTVYRDSRLSLREFEGARARVAQINGCTACQEFRGAQDIGPMLAKHGDDPAQGVSARGGAAPDEAFYAAIADWRGSPLFSARERIAIEMAERYSLAPQSFKEDEDFWANVHAHYSDPELVDLLLAIGGWVSAGRAMHILELDSICVLAGREPAPVAIAAE